MYEIGDYIIYSNHGVCRVEDIGSLDISGIDKSVKCYTLQPVFSKSSTLYTPVDNDKVSMRKVISNEEAKELIEQIPHSVLWVEMTSKKNKQAFKDRDCLDWARIIKTYI